MEDLTKNEELILLSIWRLKDNAYGITIRKNVMEQTKRKLHYGSLYNTMYKLEKKGFVITENSDPEAKKGGRSRILYYLSAEGKKALDGARKIHNQAWEGIPEYVFKKE